MVAQAPAPLPRVQTKRQLMDYLEDQIAAPAAGSDGGPSGNGRPRELASYVIDAAGGLAPSGGASGTAWEVAGTGVEKIKILRVRRDGRAPAEFFADVSDKRFPLLHTVGEQGDAGAAIDGITELRPPTFDRMWLPHAMLDAIAREGGNTLEGFGVRFADGLAGGGGNGVASPQLEDLSLTLNGPLARRIDDRLRRIDCLQDTIAYRRIRAIRGRGGAADNHARDDVYGDGCFVMKRGRSVRDHVDLVRLSKGRYSRAIKRIERCRLGSYRVDGKWQFRGEPLNFEIRKKIPDVGLFVRSIFNSTKPFSLWGLEDKVEEGYYSVAAVDLRTGDPINFEIADDMMRVYLNKRGRGNTVMRLLCNLQACFGTSMRCRQVEEASSG